MPRSTRAELDQALAAFGRERRIVVPPARCVGGPAGVDLGVGVTLEDAEAALAQAGVGRDRQIDDRGDRLRRVVGAHQVAREDRLEALAGERLGDPRGLPAAARAEAGVELALHAHLGIPLRLAMADGDDSRHLFGAQLHPRRRLSVYVPECIASARTCPSIALRSSAPPKRPSTGARATESA